MESSGGRKPAIAFGERLYFWEVREGTRVLKEGRYVGHHGHTGSLMLITPEGVKRGTGFRRVPSADRWDPAGWDQLRGVPWELSAPRPAIGERFISEDRLFHHHRLKSEWRLEGQPYLIPRLAEPGSLRRWKRMKLEQRDSRHTVCEKEKRGTGY